jgi:hypothetical protein
VQSRAGAEEDLLFVSAELGGHWLGTPTSPRMAGLVADTHRQTDGLRADATLEEAIEQSVPQTTFM